MERLSNIFRLYTTGIDISYQKLEEMFMKYKHEIENMAKRDAYEVKELLPNSGSTDMIAEELIEIDKGEIISNIYRLSKVCPDIPKDAAEDFYFHGVTHMGHDGTVWESGKRYRLFLLNKGIQMKRKIL